MGKTKTTTKATMKQRRTSREVREIRDQEWLWLHQEGKSTSAIAEEAGVSVQLVRRALARARESAASREREIAEETPLSIRGEKSEPGSPAGVPSPGTPWWLELVPLFPIGAFTPSSECPHRGPIQKGSLLCCMVCSASGMDDHPAMKRDPAAEPRREPRPSARSNQPVPEAPPKSDAPAETRRQRRARKFAGRQIREDQAASPIPHSPH